LANRKISELPAAGALSGAELIEAVQGGTNVQTTAQAIADLGGGGGAAGGPFSKTETGTTYTPTDADHNYIIHLTNAAGVTVTLPNTITDGIYFTFIRDVGAGVITFVEGGTSTFNTLGDETTIDEEKAWVSWKKDGATEWYGAGGLGPLGGGGGGGTWGSITGTLSDQTDIQSALNAKEPTLTSTSASTASGTVTLDMNNLTQRMFVGSASFATSKTMALSNSTNALVFNFHFEVTNVAGTLVMPASWLMADINFGANTWVPPAIGKYELGGSYDGTNWKIKIMGPFQ
jgi:hypothetical protein